MIAKGGDLVKPAIIEGAKIGRLDHYAPLLAAYKQQDIIRDGLVDLMDRNRLDALVLPYRTVLTEHVGLTSSNPHNDDERNTISSYTGLPMIVVPGGFYPSDGMPFGVEFVGRLFSEPTLITLASGFEAVTRHRKAPPVVPPLPGESFKY
jgi:amidase